MAAFTGLTQQALTLLSAIIENTNLSVNQQDYLLLAHTKRSTHFFILKWAVQHKILQDHINYFLLMLKTVEKLIIPSVCFGYAISFCNITGKKTNLIRHLSNNLC